MKTWLIVAGLLLAGTSLAGTTFSGPFLSTPGDRAMLEQKFSRTAFCRAFGCQKRPPDGIYHHSVFKLNNGLEVNIDTWHASGLFIYFLPHQMGSPELIRTMKALVHVASGENISFDFAKNCSSAEAIGNAKEVRFSLKSTGRMGVINCVKDTLGIPKGQENTSAEYMLRFYFAIALPV